LISEINKKLHFLTWEDVLQTYRELNKDNRMDKIIEMLKEIADEFAGNGIKKLV
jgi:hypothetical protein